MAVASDYGGLWAWLKGDTGFVDQSGNSRTITLPGTTHNPTIVTGAANGHDVMQFVATSQQYFTLPSMTALTAGELYIVMKRDSRLPPNDAQSGFIMMGTAGALPHSAVPYSDNNIYEGFGTTARKVVSEGTLDLSSHYAVYNVRSASGSYAIGVDGTDLLTSATNTVGFPSTPVVGAGLPVAGYFPGRMAEIIIYDQIRTSVERAALIASLMHTYSPNLARVTATGLSALVDVLQPIPAARVTASGLSVLVLPSLVTGGKLVRAYLID